MNVMSSLTVRQMRLNRRRTLITILGVIIAVAMITAVSSFTGSFQDLFYRSEIATGGNWHVYFEGADTALRDRIAKMDGVETTYFTRFEGFTVPEQATTGHARYALLSLEENAFDPLQIKLTEGRLPQNDREIVISSTYFDHAKDTLTLGDTLTLQNGTMTVTEDEQTYPLPYSSYSFSDAVFTPGTPQTYTVVGIATMKPISGPWDTIPMVTLLDPTSLAAGDATQLYVREAKLSRTIYDRFNPIFNETQLGGSFNSSLLFYSGVTYDDDLTRTMLVMSAVLVAIIMIGSISLIYNSFAISLSERASQFGMLSSLGATSRQNRHSVLTEAGVISLLSIPFGIGFGLLGIGITFRIVSPMLMQSFNLEAPLRLKVLPLALVAAVVLSLVTIFLSAWLPARRAARITPMQAIRRSEDVKLRGKDVKTSSLFRRLFGFEGEIALKNLKRNRKRYRVTLLSLVTSLVLFLAAVSFTFYMKSSFLVAQEEVPFNVAVSVSHSEQDASVLSAMRKIAALEPAASPQYYLYQHAQSRVPEAFLTPEAIALGIYPYEDLYDVYYSFYGMEDDALRAFCAAQGIDSAPLFDEAQPAVLYLNHQILKQGTNFAEYNPFALKAGDTISVSVDDTDRTLSVGGVCSSLPEYLSDRVYNAGSGTFLLRASAMNALYGPGTYPTGQVYFSSADADALCGDVDALIAGGEVFETSVSYQNLEGQMRQVNQMFTIVNIFVFGFITLIALIGCANILNTVTTSLMLRRRELAMLRSVGMTPKSFARMIRFESLLYGLKALLYGLPIGFAVMYGMHSLLRSNFETPFTVPWGGVLAGSLLILAIVALSMAYSSVRLKRDNIIEALRADNI